MFLFRLKHETLVQFKTVSVCVCVRWDDSGCVLWITANGRSVFNVTDSRQCRSTDVLWSYLSTSTSGRPHLQTL